MSVSVEASEQVSVEASECGGKSSYTLLYFVQLDYL